MSFVGSGVVLAAGITAAGAAYAAHQQSKAANNATNAANARYGQIQGNSQPYMDAGVGATDTLTQLLGTSGTPGSTVAGTGGLQNGYLTSTFNPTQQQLESYPGYQFQLQQGGQAVRNADTPGVGALSGAALKDLTSFNQGLAASNYNTYFNQDQTQKNNIFNRLSSIAGLGQSAAAGVGNSGTQLGNTAAAGTAAAGAASASGILGATSSLSSGVNTDLAMQYLNAQYPGVQMSNGLTYDAGHSGGYTTTVPGSVGPPQPATGS